MMKKLSFLQKNIFSKLNFSKMSFNNFSSGLKTIDLIKILRAETSKNKFSNSFLKILLINRLPFKSHQEVFRRNKQQLRRGKNLVKEKRFQGRRKQNDTYCQHQALRP